MTKVERISIELIRVALGVTDHLPYALSENQWKALLQFASDQSMAGILFAGIERLPKNEYPPLRVMMRFHGQSEFIKQENLRHQQTLAEFARLMDSNDIQYVVFKGQAAASLYKYDDKDLSLDRSPGDIDFYVPASDFNRAVEVIERELGVEIERCDVDKHYAFDWHEIRFEMHYQMETFGYAKHQRYFSQLVDSCFDTQSSNKLSFFTADDAAIPMLPPVIDMLLVFKHWFTHLLGEGVGLRQTTDIAVLISVYQDVIDVRSLRRHLASIGYLKAFDAVVALVNKYFGIQWKAYSVSEKDTRFADKLMIDVLKNGNFGRSSYEHTEGTEKRLETTKRFFTHCFRYFPLAKMDILMSIPLRIAISIKAH